MGANASRQDVARLFARAAFGAAEADLDRWENQPYEAVVDHLLDIPAARAPQPDEPRRIAIEVGGSYSDNQIPRQLRITFEQAQRWWIERMRTTPYPLEERMVLFWHDHFATGPGGPFPDVSMMMQQNQTLRRNALGSFRTMCEEITVDPAMLYWLNGVQNTRGKPNENYAREFFELFTLGTIPQIYSEDDIRESARALTGWIVSPDTRTPAFVATRHDNGRKVVLGRTITNLGDQEYKAIVDVALAQDVAPYFVAYKIVLNFAYAPATTDLLARDDPLVSAVADALRQSGWDLKAGMRALLVHDAFRGADPAREQQIVRQPIDLVASAARALGVSADTSTVTALLTAMGQRPFDPPNVGGWPVGRNWLSPVTTLARYDWGVECYALWNASNTFLRRALPASADLGGWAGMLGLAELHPNTRAAIEEYLAGRATAPEAEKQAGVLILLASSPDWMVM